MKYEIVDAGGVDVVQRTSPEGVVVYIPSDEENTDYQAYLAWKAEQ